MQQDVDAAARAVIVQCFRALKTEVAAHARATSYYGENVMPSSPYQDDRQVAESAPRRERDARMQVLKWSVIQYSHAVANVYDHLRTMECAPIGCCWTHHGRERGAGLVNITLA